MSTNKYNLGMFFKGIKTYQSDEDKQFKGPEAYQVDDKNIFKGREVETQQLLYMVEHNDWCVCYARSGEGKSSLINAGLIPALWEKRMLPIVIRFDVDTEEGHLKDVDFDYFVWNEIKSINNLTIIDNPIVNPDQSITNKLWWKLRSKDFRVITKDSVYKPVIPVLIFDQFEEVFTKPKKLQWTYKFFEWLEELYRDEIPVNKDKNENYNLNEHYFPKRFKALFSLRNEYVSELDYWSMERFFIPSLKNNRYYLKPLTIAAAKEVTKQLTNWPRGIDEDNVIKAATDDKYKFFEENEESKTGDHPQGPPCVSALILSLVLSKLEESDEFVRQELIEMDGKEYSTSNQKEFMEKLFDHIYEEALFHSGVGLKSSLRDRLEEKLIDDNGRRKRPSVKDLEKEKDIAKVIKQLKEKRIVCINNGEVELSHDSISATVARHRTQRLKQLERQREIAFLVPTLFLLFVANVFGIRFILEETTLLYIESNDFRWIYWIFEGINFIYIPLLIVSFVKNTKKTRWLSLIGFICNLILLFLLRKEELWSDTNVICFATTIIPLAFFLLSWLYKQSLSLPVLKTVLNNVPFLVYLFSILLFTFIECIWGDFYSISLFPTASFWGVIILPPLACYITTKIIKSQSSNVDKDYKLQKRVIKILPHASYLCALSLLACDTAYWLHRLPSSTIIILIVCIFVYYLCFCFKRTTTSQRVMLVFSNFIFFSLVYMANLGYNPLKICYNSAKFVYNWTIVYSEENGKWGVLDAINGDTIIPCVMERDNFQTGAGICEIKVDTCMNVNLSNIESDLYPTNRTIDSLINISYNKSPDGSFVYDARAQTATGRFWVLSKLEELLKKKEGIKEEPETSTDSLIELYSAKAFRELRNANLYFLLKHQAYTLNDIPSFNKLDSLQFCKYEYVLEKTLGSNDKIDLTDTGFHEVNRALARTFLLCAIKDMVNKQELNGLFTMMTLYSYLYFAEDDSWLTNYKGQFNLSQGGMTQTDFYISGKDFKDKAYSYYYMFLQIVSIDIWVSFRNCANMIKLQERIDASFSKLLSDENLNKARNLSAKRPKMDASQLFANVNTNKDNKGNFVNSFLQNMERIKGYYKEHDKWTKDISQYAKQTKTRVDQMLTDMDRLHVGYISDDSFERINEKTSIAFISYIERYPMSPYNMGFIRILQALYSSGFYRGYDMNEKVMKVGALVEKNKDLSYQLMKEYLRDVNKMKDEKERLETLSRLMQGVIEANQKFNSK